MITAASMLRLVTRDDRLVKSLSEDWRAVDLDERLRLAGLDDRGSSRSSR